MKEDVLFLSENDIVKLLSPKDVIEAVEDVFKKSHREEIIRGQVARMDVEVDKRNFFMSFPTMIKQQNIAGMKWYYGCNDHKLGYPYSHGSVILLSDTQTGGLLAIMGASNITAMRTAGGHGVVAAKYLSRSNPREAAVIGGGRQARAGIAGLLEQFPSINTIRLWVRRENSARSIIEAYKERAEIQIFSDIREAVREVPIVMAATASQDVLIKSEFISPGTTIIGISGLLDVDPALAERADKWVVGDYSTDVNHIIHSSSARHGYPLSEDHIYASLTEIIMQDKAGRKNAEEIILYTHLGMGAFDLSCARKAYQKAVERKIGVSYSLE